MGGAADTVLKRVGALADGYVCGTASLKRFTSVWDKIAAAAAANGRDPASIHKAGITYLTIDENRIRAKAACEEYLRAYYGKINLDVESETRSRSAGRMRRIPRFTFCPRHRNHNSSTG